MKVKQGLKDKIRREIRACSLASFYIVLLAVFAWESVVYQNKANKEKN
jgi:hypothetical protein|tara:strand:- start:79 stop:222 length:144 start_codon:yes stop_codon:yes gene_type:complete